jgi:hypothetical protein
VTGCVRMGILRHCVTCDMPPDLPGALNDASVIESLQFASLAPGGLATELPRPLALSVEARTVWCTASEGPESEAVGGLVTVPLRPFLTFVRKLIASTVAVRTVSQASDFRPYHRRSGQ